MRNGITVHNAEESVAFQTDSCIMRAEGRDSECWLRIVKLIEPDQMFENEIRVNFGGDKVHPVTAKVEGPSWVWEFPSLG